MQKLKNPLESLLSNCIFCQSNQDLAVLKAKPAEGPRHEHYKGEKAMDLKHWMNVGVLVSKYQQLGISR